jgi:hypothetical protein
MDWRAFPGMPRSPVPGIRWANWTTNWTNELTPGYKGGGIRRATNSHWAPTICIHVPMSLANTASQSILNTRCRSGAQAETAVAALL